MSRRVSRHLPLLLLTALVLLSAVSACGDDEPRHARSNDHDTPADTTRHPNDTTAHHGTDTTATDTTTSPPFTLTITAPRPYGYMGQTMQLTAVTGAPATVLWRSSHTAVATVDAGGLVTFANARQDGTTVISAAAGGTADSILLTCRHWAVAAWASTAWAVPDYHTVHPGDTVALTIVGANGQPVDDDGFNAGACDWALSCRDADVARVITPLANPAAANGWQAIYLIADDAPAGTLVTVIASHGVAAASLTISVQ